MRPGFEYIGVSICFFAHDGKGNFVMHKRSKNCRDEQETWDFGGGKLEFGETIEQAVLRELQEEYGCTGTIQKQLSILSTIRTHHGEKTHWILIPHLVLVTPAEVKLNEPEKMDAIGWFTWETMPEPLHSGVAVEMQKYRAAFYALPK